MIAVVVWIEFDIHNFVYGAMKKRCDVMLCMAFLKRSIGRRWDFPQKESGNYYMRTLSKCISDSLPDLAYRNNTYRRRQCIRCCTWDKLCSVWEVECVRWEKGKKILSVVSARDGEEKIRECAGHHEYATAGGGCGWKWENGSVGIFEYLSSMQYTPYFLERREWAYD